MAVSNGGRLPSLILRGICTEVETLTRLALFFFRPCSVLFFFVMSGCIVLALLQHSIISTLSMNTPIAIEGYIVFPTVLIATAVHLSNSDVYRHCPACCSTTTAM